MNSLIYFVNLNDFLVSHNFGFTKTISSPGVAEYGSFQRHHPVYTEDVNKFENDINLFHGSFLSPRLSILLMSIWKSNGLDIGIGLNDTKWLEEQETSKINRIAQLEIDFEKGRRKYSPTAPSRLTSIYLAENNIDGRRMLQNMFTNRTNFIIVEVKIKSTLRDILIADSRWVEKYENEKNEEYIANYWLGEKVDNYPLYEYLLEGQIILVNESDQHHIKQFGAKR